jgi:glycosyltransferase involved in cell wall biosynthesis
MTRFNLSQQDRVLLYVGGIDPRKNWPVLVEIAASFKENHQSNPQSKRVLLIVGKMFDLEFPRFKATIQARGVEEYIIFTGYLPDNELAMAYAAANLFVFPSLYEGFGLTPLEALAAGLPVISSHTSSMPEVLGEHVLYADPYHSRTFVDSVNSLIDLPKSQTKVELVKKHAAQFTWKETARLTVESYKRAFLSISRL